MITLKSPPKPAIKALHLNSSSTSPGGKDYVLVWMSGGELWAINGPAFKVRNNGGAVQHPSRSWQDMVAEKTRKGYTVIGEYGQGQWWSQIGAIYVDVPNLATKQPTSEPIPEPKPKHAVRPQQALTLAEKYPASRLVRDAFKDMQADEWFYLI